MWDSHGSFVGTKRCLGTTHALVETPFAIRNIPWNGKLSRNEGERERGDGLEEFSLNIFVGKSLSMFANNCCRLSFFHFGACQPIFKWNSATPWSELQLSPNLGAANGATLGQLAAIAFPKVMWLIIQFRVLGYCIKNYYLVNRHAVKRTTTFAGKHAAFSAALEATETLKKSKKNKQ